MDGHRDGLEIYAVTSEYNDLINRHDKTLIALEDVEARLADDLVVGEERARLRKKRRRLEAELDEYRIDIRAFERIQGWPKRALN